jgi:hypothetical protein
MRRSGVGSIARIAKIYDLMRGFDWVNKAGICERVALNVAVIARIIAGRSVRLAKPPA